MTMEQLITVVENKGVGFVLILGVGYLLWILVKGFRKMAKDFYDLLHKAVYNHLEHVQTSMETLVTNSTEANKKLDVQNVILGIHGQKLDRISEKVMAQTDQTATVAEKVAEVAQAVTDSKKE